MPIDAMFMDDPPDVSCPTVYATRRRTISLIPPAGVLSVTACLCQLTKKRSSNGLRPSVNIAGTEIEGTEELPTATDGEPSGAPEPATAIADRKWDCRRLFPNGQSKIIAATPSDAAGLHTVDPRAGYRTAACS